MIRRLCKDCKHNDENEFCNDCGYFYRETTASGSRNKSVTQKTTNADCIRAMSDEELAMWINDVTTNALSVLALGSNKQTKTIFHWLDWLKREENEKQRQNQTVL